MIKIAMIRIHEEMRRREMRSSMIMQVHDELVFEIKEEHLSVGSQYFLLTADVILGDAPLTLQSVLYRTANGNITTVSRRFGPSRERILAGVADNL